MRTPGRGRQTPSPGSRAGKRARTSSGCGRGGDARPLRSSSPRPSQRSRGSSRIDKPRPARTSAAQRHPPSRLHSTSPSFARNGGWRHSRRRIRAPVTPRKFGSRSAALAPALQRSPPTADRVALSISEFRARLHLTLIRKRRLVRAQHLTNRVAGQPQVACDLLDRLAVNEVLTPYPTDRLHNQHPPPPASCQSRQSNKSKIGGSILDADPPPQGVTFPRRITVRAVPLARVRRLFLKVMSCF